MASLAEIRAKLAAMENRSSGNSKNNDTSLFPFWNMDKDTTSVVRFLPDLNEDNTFFWVEKQVIKIPFAGIKGGDESKKTIVQVPCVEMWGDTCPVHQEIRPWFKDPSLEETARTYWKKRSYIFQGLVRTDGVGEKPEDIPENPIRRLVLGKQIFNIVKAALLDPDMEHNPTDMINGVDFKITRTHSGTHAGYDSSAWARKESSLTEEELAAVTEHGLKNLEDYLPKRPTADQLATIFEMFEASVEGDLYDPEQWAEHYKPYGLEYNAKSSSAKPSTPVPAAAPAAEPEGDKIPFEADVAVAEAAVAEAPEAAPAAAMPVAEEAIEPKKSADDILAMLRNRA